jgi:hypothetical protein
MVRVLLAFFAVGGDADRFFAVVRAPRVFFAVVRFPGRFVVERNGDFETERFPPLELPARDALLAGLPDRDCEERRGADRPELCLPGVPFEPADRSSRTSSRPAATAPSIMLARSNCLTAMRALSAA